MILVVVVAMSSPRRRVAEVGRGILGAVTVLFLFVLRGCIRGGEKDIGFVFGRGL